LVSRREAASLDAEMRVSPRARELGWIPGLKGVARNVPRLLEERRDR
jgi:hypothetical protein